MTIRSEPVRFLLLLLFVLVGSLPSRADEGVTVERVRSAVLSYREGNAAARASLDSLLEVPAVAADAALAAGFLALDDGDTARARVLLARAESEHSRLHGYAALELAEIDWAAEDPEGTLRHLQGLGADDLSPGKLARARFRQGEVLTVLDRPAEAEEALREVVQISPADSLGLAARFLLAELSAGRGNALEAYEWFASIQRIAPVGREARRAEKRAHELEKDSGVEPPSETARSLFDRARAFETAGQLGEARDLYRRVEEASGDELEAQARWRRARVDRRTGHVQRAERTLNDLLETLREGGTPADDPVFLDARLEAMRIAIARGQDDRAHDLWALLLQGAPQSDAAYRGTLVLADRRESEKDPEGALACYDGWLEANPGHAGVPRVQWEMGRLYRLEGNLEAAIRTYDALATCGSIDFASAALFWGARLCHETGDEEESAARARLLLRRYPFTYYGHRGRVLFDAAVEIPRTASPPDPAASDHAVAEAVMRTLPPSNPAPGRGAGVVPGYERARALFAIGFPALAYQELAPFVSPGVEGEGTPPGEWALLAAVLDGGMWPEGIAALRRGHGDELASGRTEKPDLVWRIAYPRAFRADVEEAARAAGVDSLLLWAIVRQESAFDPDIVSPAGAVGLTQLMPETAGELSGRRGRSLHADELRDARRNLELGARYLARLLERWPGRLPVVLAAYNAGPTRAARWAERWEGESEESLVDAIPYVETRVFVKAVIRNLEEYRRLYATPLSEEAGLRATTTDSTPQGIPSR